jgi:hypothetical protein
VLALAKTVDAFIEPLDGDVEVSRVTSSRFEPEAGGSDEAGLYEREVAEADKRGLLNHLVERDAANAEEESALAQLIRPPAPTVATFMWKRVGSARSPSSRSAQPEH